MLEEIKHYFYSQYNGYMIRLKDKDISTEFAFYNLKNKYGENLELKLVLEIPELRNWLKKNPKGEKSFFHFGKDNSELSQINAALTQKYI